MNVVPKYKFSGHQTFTFRYGWLEKGVREVAADAAFFTRDDALVKLGVGKNMVASIHHWCLVTRMIEEKPSAKRKRGRGFKPTEIASKLLLDGGWDPIWRTMPPCRSIGSWLATRIHHVANRILRLQAE